MKIAALHHRFMRVCLAAALTLTPLCTFAQELAVQPAAPNVLVLNGVEMAPIRPVAELLGGSIRWNQRTGVVTAYANAHTFACLAGSTAARQDGLPVTLPQEPFNMTGTLYAPLHMLVTALGGTATVDKARQTATLDVPGVRATLNLPITRDINLATYTDDDLELHVVSLDGTGMRRLTFNDGDDRYPAISPDGVWLASVREEGIYLRRANAAQARCLVAADPQTRYLAPQFSPDSLSLLFLAQRKGETATRLMRVGVDGSDLRALADGSDPCFSPNGATIAFTAWDVMAKHAVIRLLNISSGSQRVLGEGQFPVYSPDGAMLLFTKAQSVPGGGEVNALVTYVLSGEKAGTSYAPTPERGALDDRGGRFSPDGRRVLFMKRNEGIFTMTADGAGLRRVATGGDYTLATYTPDGAHIIFVRDGNLCSMEPNGADIRQFTNGIQVQHATLTPDGTQVIFTAQPRLLCDKKPLSHDWKRGLGEGRVRRRSAIRYRFWMMSWL